MGSKYSNKCAGTFGLASCISFYPAKILGTLGDAGIVLTNDDEMYEKLLLYRNHGRDEEDDVAFWAFNSRMDNLHAAFLAMQFKGYTETIRRRREIASSYQEQLGDLTELVLPPAPDSDPAHFDVFQNYEIEAERRDELKSFLAERGVGTHIQWGGKAVHQFARLGFTQDLPHTTALMGRILMLPLNLSLTDDEIDYVSNCLKAFYRS